MKGQSTFHLLQIRRIGRFTEAEFSGFVDFSFAHIGNFQLTSCNFEHPEKNINFDRVEIKGGME